MKEVKPSKKPLAIYYAIVLLVLLVINLVVMPWLAERQVQEVDYGTFMSMTEQENIGKVDIQSNQIIFTDKDNKQIYRTGLMNDPGLTERLYDAGVQLHRQPDEQKADGKGRRRPGFYDVRQRGQIQRKGVCAVHPRHPLCGRCR